MRGYERLRRHWKSEPKPELGNPPPDAGAWPSEPPKGLSEVLGPGPEPEPDPDLKEKP